MLSIGAAGTGKSKTIVAFVWLLWQHEIADWLVLSGYTHRSVINWLDEHLGPAR